MTSFHDFGLAEPLTRALAEENYTTPTPIQTKTIPVAAAGRDVIGIAQTGTGKTAAFALPILQRLLAAPKRAERKGCRVLVLSPTRELSGQILESFRVYGRHLRIRSALAIGGVSMGAQVRALLDGVDVLVATPGRLLDLVQSNALRLGAVEFLVLDEADRMLDMGFINDIRKIVAKLPAERQTMLFSATMPRAIAELAERMLRDPVKLAVAPVAATADLIDQRLIRVDRGGKAATLVDVLRREPIDRALVFTRTKHGADRLVRALGKSGIAAEAIHGNKSQNQRERVLAAFRSGTLRILIATDIAARGIDVDGISHVVNFDLPNVPETYVHRIGRTARAGASGIAISLCDADDAVLLRDVEKLIRMTIPASDRRSAPHQETQRPQQRQQQQQRHQPQRHQPQQRHKSQQQRQPDERNGQRPHAARPHAARPHAGRPQGRHAEQHAAGTRDGGTREAATPPRKIAAFLHRSVAGRDADRRSPR